VFGCGAAAGEKIKAKARTRRKASRGRSKQRPYERHWRASEVKRRARRESDRQKRQKQGRKARTRRKRRAGAASRAPTRALAEWSEGAASRARAEASFSGWWWGAEACPLSSNAGGFTFAEGGCGRGAVRAGCGEGGARMRGRPIASETRRNPREGTLGNTGRAPRVGEVQGFGEEQRHRQAHCPGFSQSGRCQGRASGNARAGGVEPRRGRAGVERH